MLLCIACMLYKHSKLATCTRRMEPSCSPFVRGFLPGILIGLFSSVLLYNTLWRQPVSTTQTQESLFITHRRLSLDQPPYPAKLRKAEHLVRRLRASDSDEDCDPSVYLKTLPPEQSTFYLLVVLIHSTPRASDQRDAIRASWLSKQQSQNRYLSRFVIGVKNLKMKDIYALACESKRYGDLLLLPSETDSLKQLDWSSSSKLIASLKWTMSAIKFSYILKCTDSTFAVLDTIVQELDLRESNNKTGDFLWGFFAGGMLAAKEGRLSEKNWFLCSHYLPFPQGGGYVISHSLVSFLLSLETELQHYEHDDIGMGVWISPFNGIEKLHDVRFNSGYYSRGCQNVYILTHKETVPSMMQKYTSLMQTGQLCKEEFVSRLSYVYNWTAPANRCCVRKPEIP